MTAKKILNVSETLCSIRETHDCSAGIVVLQDAVELVMLAALLELGVDEKKSLENLTFHKMIDELRIMDITVPKSGTIKAMYKHRVLIKHYGSNRGPGYCGKIFFSFKNFNRYDPRTSSE